MDLERLERLAQLRRSGVLTDEEFDREKAELLAAEERVPPKNIAAAKWLWVVAAIAMITGVVLAAKLISTDAVHPTPLKVDVAKASPPAANAAPTATRPVAQLDRPYDTSPFTEEELRLIAQWREANEMCRGSPDEQSIEKWCPRRDASVRALNRAGICYGHAGDTSAADYEMHRCEEGSYAF